MSDKSDFESIISDVVISPCSSTDDINTSVTNHSKSQPRNKTNHEASTYNAQYDLSLTDSDQSLLSVPKQLKASSPSSVCSTKPLEWDSGADVGYDMMSKQQSQEMSTIERIAVSNLVYNANSTPINHIKKPNIRTKSNSLTNLNKIESSKKEKSASFEALKCTALKSDTLPKFRSPMTSSLSVSTVVHKLKTPNFEQNKQLSNTNINFIFKQQEKRFEKLNISYNKEQKSSDSSKESNSTLGSADTAGSWIAKEFHNSTHTTTDRVNSFEYLPGNAYYDRDNELEDCSDKEIKQSTKILVEVMKQKGLTNEFQRNKIFKEIIESFLKNYDQKNTNLSLKSASDTDQSPVKQDFTSHTSNTANTIVNIQTNNHSSTITFTSPITSSRYGDDVDSKYDESSMDSGRHIDLKKCKLKKMYTSSSKQKNQSVQCTMQDSLTRSYKNENLNKSLSSKSNASKRLEENMESSLKKDVQSKTKSKSDISNEFKKQLIWFQANYIKIERENQKFWINYHQSHLKNLEKLCHNHEELKKNWNLYKQKHITNHKPKYKRSLLPVSSSSSDFTSTSKIDSSISSKQLSINSKCYDTDIESSTTVCDHIHYKRGIPFDEPKSMKKCCENTLHIIKEKPKQSVNKLKTAWSQTEPINEIETENYKKNTTQNSATYTVDQQLKPFNRKNAISYDIIFKPTERCSKEICVDNRLKKQKPSMSVACQTNKIPFEPKSSLQEYLKANRPDYICQAEKRQNILSDLASLRDKRKQLKQDLLLTNNTENKIPPNPLAMKRVMSQKEMRKQTERKYKKCPEVKNKKIEIKRKQEYKTNKMMANLFNKKLQKKTLKGKVDLSNSVSVCSL